MACTERLDIAQCFFHSGFIGFPIPFVPDGFFVHALYTTKSIVLTIPALEGTYTTNSQHSLSPISNYLPILEVYRKLLQNSQPKQLQAKNLLDAEIQL
jgi:hypothetical protein